MKVKLFDVGLDNVPAGKSPATQLEDQINAFVNRNSRAGFYLRCQK